MSRYIDVEQIEYPLFESGNDETWMKVAINATPTADVKKIEYGEWEWDANEEMFYCTNCGVGYKKVDPTNYNYCPYCGAITSESLKMKRLGNCFIEGLKEGLKVGEKHG